MKIRMQSETMATYTIDKVGLLPSRAEMDFIYNADDRLCQMYGFVFKPGKFNMMDYVTRGGRVVFCKRDGVPVGFMFSRLFHSIFDSDIKILYQDVLYTETKRATRLLLKDFIDFGKANANHVITMIGHKTNIKGRSLERLGFKELETLYRFEV